jgi:hypothetical protein
MERRKRESRQFGENMEKHKWKRLNPSIKYETCEHCGLTRDWLYGDMQCWEYTPVDYGKRKFNKDGTVGMIDRTFKKPDCDSQKQL